MKLFETPGNPVPPGARVGTLRTLDGARLRAAYWVPGTARRGTVAILPGRGEFIEKYFETVGELLKRGFAAAALDWRGQGGSARQLRNARKGHVDDFSFYERDLHAFVEDVLGPSCPQPWFAIGHSMGASVLLSASHAGRSPFERHVLTSPMIDIRGVRHPKAARLLAATLDALGLGGAYAPGGGSKGVDSMPFEDNILTADRQRFARIVETARAAPELVLGWPTVAWVHSAFRLMRRLKDSNFPRRISTPTLVVAAGADRIADTRAIERFCARLRAGRLIVLEGAEHEILMERDIFRDQFWAAFDAFVPGVEAEARRHALTS